MKTFKQQVVERSKELSIEPKLLLFSLVALSNDPESTEYQVMKSVFTSLTNDMKVFAEGRLNHNDAKVRDRAKESLSPIDPLLMGLSDSETFGALQFSKIIDEGQEVLGLHYAAWNKLTSDQLKLRNKYFRKAESLDVVQIIKYLFPDLVEESKRIYPLLMKGGLSLN